MNDQVEDQEATETKSIIDPKYAKMRGASDWIGELLEHEALEITQEAVAAVPEVKNEKGEVVEKAKRAVAEKRKWDIDAVFALAEANAIDTKKYDSMKAHPSGVGRARMTISNMLRSAAKKRHGLYDTKGNWHETPEGFPVNETITQNRDGSAIMVKKPEKEKAEISRGALAEA